MNSLTKTQKMFLTSETWKKNSAEMVEILMTKTGDINFTTSITKKYCKFIHDFFEENSHLTPAIQEHLLEKLNPEWFINKLKNQVKN